MNICYYGWWAHGRVYWCHRPAVTGTRYCPEHQNTETRGDT